MKLLDTVKRMLSNHWQNRMIAEYWQLCIRIERLENYRMKDELKERRNENEEMDEICSCFNCAGVNAYGKHI